MTLCILVKESEKNYGSNSKLFAEVAVPDRSEDRAAASSAGSEERRGCDHSDYHRWFFLSDSDWSWQPDWRGIWCMDY